jgi:hypothetical protein
MPGLLQTGRKAQVTSNRLEHPMHHGDVSPEIAQGLLTLKKRIASVKIPPSQLDETIHVAAWCTSCTA